MTLGETFRVGQGLADDESLFPEAHIVAQRIHNHHRVQSTSFIVNQMCVEIVTVVGNHFSTHFKKRQIFHLRALGLPPLRDWLDTFQDQVLNPAVVDRQVDTLARKLRKYIETRDKASPDYIEQVSVNALVALAASTAAVAALPDEQREAIANVANSSRDALPTVGDLKVFLNVLIKAERKHMDLADEVGYSDDHFGTPKCVMDLDRGFRYMYRMLQVRL